MLIIGKNNVEKYVEMVELSYYQMWKTMWKLLKM